MALAGITYRNPLNGFTFEVKTRQDFDDTFERALRPARLVADPRGPKPRTSSLEAEQMGQEMAVVALTEIVERRIRGDTLPDGLGFTREDIVKIIENTTNDDCELRLAAVRLAASILEIKVPKYIDEVLPDSLPASPPLLPMLAKRAQDQKSVKKQSGDPERLPFNALDCEQMRFNLDKTRPGGFEDIPEIVTIEQRALDQLRLHVLGTPPADVREIYMGTHREEPDDRIRAYQHLAIIAAVFRDHNPEKTPMPSQFYLLSEIEFNLKPIGPDPAKPSGRNESDSGVKLAIAKLVDVLEVLGGDRSKEKIAAVRSLLNPPEPEPSESSRPGVRVPQSGSLHFPP